MIARAMWEADVPVITPTRLLQIHKHRVAEGSVGDCFRTAIACLLGVSHPEAVPHFCEQAMAAGLNDHGGWEDIAAARRWLRVAHDLDLIMIRRENADEIGCAYKLTVKSQAGPWHHAVVARAGEVIWDPAGVHTYTMEDAVLDEPVGVICTPYAPDPDEMLRIWRAEAAG